MPDALIWTVATTAAGGLLSVLVASLLTVAVLGRIVRGLVSFSAGVLLGTALLHLLPEAFEAGTEDPQHLFLALLIGLLGFWLLEKVEVYRHVHHHQGDGHHHHSHFDRDQAGRGGLTVLVGDSIHNFCDGVIIAAAFLADTHLGLMTALAIVAHEIPQEAGDYIVLLNAGLSRRRALAYNALSGLAAVVGGVLGCLALARWQAVYPYLLVVAASSFVYVSVADLLPQLQQRLAWRQTAAQIAWIGIGLAVVVLARGLQHAH